MLQHLPVAPGTRQFVLRKVSDDLQHRPLARGGRPLKPCRCNTSDQVGNGVRRFALHGNGILAFDVSREPAFVLFSSFSHIVSTSSNDFISRARGITRVCDEVRLPAISSMRGPDASVPDRRRALAAHYREGAGP